MGGDCEVRGSLDDLVYHVHRPVVLPVGPGHRLRRRQDPRLSFGRRKDK